MTIEPTRSKSRKSSRLLWQAALVGLPVIVLVYVGLMSLRQDRILARAEATERAQVIADEIVQRVWSVITSPPSELKESTDGTLWLPRPGEPVPPGAFAVDRQGALLFPPAAQSLAANPFTSSEEVSEAWAQAQRLEIEALSGSGNPGAAIEAYKNLLANETPGPDTLIARTHYSLGLLFAKAGQADAAAERYRTVIARYPEVTVPSGVTLATLAQLKLIEMSPRLPGLDRPTLTTMIDGLSSNLVYRPTPLSLHLLERAALLEQALPGPGSLTRTAGIIAVAGPLEPLPDRWQKIWNQHEQARELFTTAQPFLASAMARASDDHGVAPRSTGHQLPRMFWLGETQKSGQDSDAPGEWLSVRAQSAAEGAWYVPQPLSTEERARIQDLQRMAGNENPSPWVFVYLNGTPGTARTNQPPVASRLFSELEKPLRRLPRYFGVSVVLAGRDLISSNALAGVSLVTAGKAGGEAWKITNPVRSPELLAVADKFEEGTEYLRVAVHLVSPALLFARQQARTTMFGSLIGLSLLAASVGFVSTCRALQRQERLADLKTNFVSSVSHELRAPIASVRLMAEGMERGRVTEESKRSEYCRFIVQECRRLSALIENVLDFSRIEQGRKQYELEPTDLVSLVGTTLGALEPHASQRQLELKQSRTGPPVAVDADGRAIQQALINLVDNAIKHSPAGATITIGLDFPESPTPPTNPSHLRSRSVVSSPPNVQLWVEDQGPGIPVEEHERIFERFYRLGSEMRRETQGVGIGLSIVKHIVEAHGGTVSVRSAPGAGSRFTISLRAHAAVPSQSPHPA